MALTVTLIEWNGSDTPGTNNGSAAANINLGSTDAIDLTPASYPVQVNARSYFKQMKFNFSGSMTQVDNVRVYKSAGAYKTEEAIEFSGSIVASTPDETDQSWASIDTSLPGSWNVVLSGGADGGTLLQDDQESTPGYTSGSRSHLMGFQLLTTSNTETGATNQKTISVTYDVQ